MEERYKTDYRNRLNISDMKQELKDLEVLEKYLSKEELKEVAKEVAYNAFSRHLGKANPHGKANLEYYIRWGAFEAVKKHITENEFKEEEFVDKLRVKVDRLITRLTPYDINLNEAVKKAIEIHKPYIQANVEEAVQEYFDLPQDDFNSLYSKLDRSATDMLQDFVITKFIESVKKEED